MAEKIFVDGMSVKEAGEKTPWIKGRFGVNKKFIEFFEQNKDERGWLNFDLCLSKNGTLYCELNTYKKGQTQSKSAETIEYPDDIPNLDDIPFN